MDQHTLDILEFHRIREILEIYATSSLGKSLALSVMPETDIEKITVWQKQVTELRKLLRDGRMPLGGIRDVRSSLNEFNDLVAVLGCEALLEIHNTLQAARKIKVYLHELDDSYPHLSKLGRRIGPFRDLEDIIFSSIDLSGKVKNNATPKLNGIRKEIEIIRARIKSKLQSLIRSPRMSRYLKKTGKSIDDIIDEEERNEPVTVTLDSIQRGDMVKILSLDMEGEVVGMLRDKNKVLVLANTMKVEIRPEDLEFVRD